MATWSGLSFGGWAPIESWLEGGMNRTFNRQSYDDQLWNSAAAGAINYEYNKKWAQEGPAYTKQGLESAGYNPILAVNSSAGAMSSSPLVGDMPIRSESHTSAGSGTPFDWSSKKAQRSLYYEEVKTQQSLQNLYNSQADRNRFIPITETDSGGLNILGSGFNVGGTDTLLFDTKTGTLVRPKKQSNSASSSGPSSPVSGTSAKRVEDKKGRALNTLSPFVLKELEKKGFSYDQLLNHTD